MPRRSAGNSKSQVIAPGDRVRQAATKLFAARGFARTSMRDLAKESGISLAGLYHHFPSKDDLFFELQRDAYERLTAPLADLSPESAPEQRLRDLIFNHITFFASDITAMKVLSHEAEALDGEMGRKMRRMRRQYFEICLTIVTELLETNSRKDLVPRSVTMTLFGMINWIYTWYKPATDGPANQLADQMSGIFLNGIERPVAKGTKREQDT